MTSRLLLIIIFLAGCTYKTRPQQSPDERPKGDIVSQNTLGLTDADSMSRPESAKPKAMPTETKLSLEKLEAIVLNTNTILKPGSKVDKNLAAQLDQYNQTLIQLANANVDISTSLKKYIIALNLGCDNTLASCRALDYFKRSENSFLVAMLIAKKYDSDLKNYYRHLKLAYLVKNVRFNFELSRMYLQNANAFALQLLKDEKRRMDFLHTVQTVLSDISLNATDEQAREAMAIFSPLKFSRRSQSAASKMNFTKLLEVVSKFGLFYDMNDPKKLNTDLVKLLEADNTGKDSFAQRQKSLIDNKQKMMKALGVTPMATNDEIFYLLERLYAGDLESEDALALWKGVRGSDKDTRLVNAAESYIKIQFLHYLNRTNIKAHEIYTREFSSEYILEYAIAHSYEVSSIWEELRKHLKPLSLFVTGAVKTDHADRDLIKRGTNLSDGFEQNIKFASVYPHMMMMAYYMSLKEFTKDFKTVRGYKFSINSFKVINDLMSGKIDTPWLSYSDDERPLNSTEIFYSLDTAIKTGSLETFNIDPDSFLLQYFIRLQGATVAGLEQDSDYYRKQWATMDSYKAYRKDCEAFKSGKPIRARIPFNKLLFTPTLGDFRIDDEPSTIILPSSQVRNKVSIYDFNADDVLEKARLDLQKTERIMKSMIAILKESLEVSSLQRAEAELDRLERIKQRVPADFMKFHLEDGMPCYLPFLERDARVAFKIVEAESEFLRQAYRDIKTIGTISHPEISGRIQAKYLKSYGKQIGLQSISPHGLRYTRLDLTVRVAQYLSNLFPSAEVIFPEDITESTPYTTNLTAFIPASISEEEFVKQGLSHAFFGQDPYLRWYYFKTHTDTFVHVMETMVTLYKFGSIKMADGKEKTISPMDILNTYKGWLRALKYTPQERQMYTQQGYTKRYNLAYLTERFFRIDKGREHVDEVYGLYDFLLLITQHEAMGNDNQKDFLEANGDTVTGRLHTKPTESALDYYTARITKSDQIYFKISAALDKLLLGSIRDPLLKDERLTNEFYEAFKAEMSRLETLPSDEAPSFDINIKLSMQKPFFSPLVRGNYERDRQKFHDKTGRCFTDSSTLCPDFQ